MKANICLLFLLLRLRGDLVDSVCFSVAFGYKSMTIWKKGKKCIVPFTTGKSSERLKNVNLNLKSVSCLFCHCPPALWPVTSHSGPVSYCPLMILALLRMKKVTKSIALEMYPGKRAPFVFLSVIPTASRCLLSVHRHVSLTAPMIPFFFQT